MKMSGEEIIAAPREVVWRALNDPAVLKQAIPGCKAITRHSDHDMTAQVQVAVGPLKVNFKGKVRLSDLKPPQSYRISGSGDGGFAGSAQGGANVLLESVPEGTRLTYDVDAQVAGRLANMGARLIDPLARKLAGEFFESFADIVANMKHDSVAAEPAAIPPARKAAVKKPAVEKTPSKKAGKKPTTKPAKKVAKKPAKKPVKKVAKKKLG